MLCEIGKNTFSLLLQRKEKKTWKIFLLPKINKEIGTF